MDTERFSPDDVAVVKTLGTTASAAAPPAAAPAAVRVARPGWRDPRLWLGVVIVAACVVAGARILGSADDTVSVWAVSGQHPAGATLARSDLVAEKVDFPDAGDLDRYFLTDASLPDDAVYVRPVGDGELLPRSALGSADDDGRLQVPLSVDPGQVPPSVGEGSVVDVWVSGSPTGDLPGDLSKPVIKRADVVSYVPASESLAASGQAQLTVAVKEAQVQAYFATVAKLDSPVVSIVRRP